MKFHPSHTELLPSTSETEREKRDRLLLERTSELNTKYRGIWSDFSQLPRSEEMKAGALAIWQQWRPQILEIGPGNGRFLLHLSKTHPEKRILAIEHKFLRTYQIVKCLEREAIGHVKIIYGDAASALAEAAVPSVEHVFINFPDPWPKQKQQKNRIFRRGIAELLAKVMKAGATLTVATDVESYALEILDDMHASEIFCNAYGERTYRNETEWQEKTYFESLARTQGKSVYFMKFIKIS